MQGKTSEKLNTRIQMSVVTYWSARSCSL